MTLALTMYRGEAKTWEFTISATGAAVNLTGATLRFVVRQSFPAGTVTADTDALILKTTSSGITLTTPASGVCEVALAKADTYTLELNPNGGLFFVALEALLSGDSEARVVDQGTLKITPDLVRGL